MLMCHENNWLFKILFKEYLKNEKEYKNNYRKKVKSIRSSVAPDGLYL